MATYTPSTLTLDDWASPLSIYGTDTIASLDEKINLIVTGDADSLTNHNNTELAKLPAYLSTELTAIFNTYSDVAQAEEAAQSAAAALVSENNAAASEVGSAAAAEVAAAEILALSVPDGVFPEDEGLSLVAREAGNDWEEILGMPDETDNDHMTVSTYGVKKDSFWTPVVISPDVISANFALVAGSNGSIVSPTISDGVTITIPDGAVLVIL